MKVGEVIIILKDGLFFVGKITYNSNDTIVLEKPLLIMFDFLAGKIGFIDMKIKEIYAPKQTILYFEPNEDIKQKYIEHTTGLTIVSATTSPFQNFSFKKL